MHKRCTKHLRVKVTTLNNAKRQQSPNKAPKVWCMCDGDEIERVCIIRFLFLQSADIFHRWFCKNKKPNNTRFIRSSDSVCVACDCRSRSEKQFTVAIVLLPVWMGETNSVWLSDCHAKARLIIAAPLGPQTQKQEVSKRQGKLLVFWWPLQWFWDFSHRRRGQSDVWRGKGQDGPVFFLSWRYLFFDITTEHNLTWCTHLLPSPASYKMKIKMKRPASTRYSVKHDRHSA